LSYVYSDSAKEGDDAESTEETGEGYDGGLADGDGCFWDSGRV
jgi:hypothetical protein